MERWKTRQLSRREVQKLMMAAPAPLVLSLAAGTVSAYERGGAVSTPILAPTPQCKDDDDLELTTAQTEGPYFTPQSPKRTSLLEDGMPGHELVVTGFVYAASCAPVAHALLDFWQCDDAGVYDNEGFRLRGHQFADDEGRFELTTIVPGLYPGRTRHIHLKVQAPGGPVLTTQLYFPDEPRNEQDGIFDERLVMHVEPHEDRDIAFYTLVVEDA